MEREEKQKKQEVLRFCSPGYYMDDGKNAGTTPISVESLLIPKLQLV